MPEPHPVLPKTLSQIRDLPKSSRPLLVCDVDEVVLHMLRPMQAYFADIGLEFIEKAMKLTGNIVRRGEETPIPHDEVRRHILGFFDEWVHAQELVDGADEALNRLSRHFDVVLLTNLPGDHNKEIRIERLKSLGIDFPLLTNSGPKGGAVAALSAGRDLPVVFIDDSTVNQQSVHASLPSATLIQFIADTDFRRNHQPDDHVDLLTGDWSETTSFIEAIMERAGRT